MRAKPSKPNLQPNPVAHEIGFLEKQTPNRKKSPTPAPHPNAKENIRSPAENEKVNLRESMQ